MIFLDTMEDELQKQFIRKFDRIVAEMSEQNPSWSTSRVTQEAKKILTAIYQNILVQEFFPIILGSEHSNIIQGLDYEKFAFMDFSVEEITFAETIGIAAKYDKQGKDDHHQMLSNTGIFLGF